LILLENFQLDMKDIKALSMPDMHLGQKEEALHQLPHGTTGMNFNKD
jgi:hypothetical protein